METQSPSGLFTTHGLRSWNKLRISLSLGDSPAYLGTLDSSMDQKQWSKANTCRGDETKSVNNRPHTCPSTSTATETAAYRDELIVRLPATKLRVNRPSSPEQEDTVKPVFVVSLPTQRSLYCFPVCNLFYCKYFCVLCAILVNISQNSAHSGDFLTEIHLNNCLIEIHFSYSYRFTLRTF